MTRRIILMLLATLAGQYADAFTPGSFQKSSAFRPQTIWRMAAADENDLSIPYDAAARNAYDEWRAQYNKGDFDDARYSSFKSNYEAITVANIVAKKAARDSSADAPRLLTLNEFGDYTAEEYEAMQAGSAESTAVSGDVLGKAFEAAQSQAGAASALMEAADALAEEGEKLARQLGLESIEELEAAVDALEGIDEEGVEETDNLAREARIRSAYLEWCKSNGKEPDESRFPTFSSNFLTMETFSASNGKEMVLNKYADCTQEEYQALVNAPAEAPASAGKALMETALSEDMAGDADVMAALAAVAEAEAAANAAVKVGTSEKEALKKAADAKAAEAAQAKLELAEKKKAEIAARAALASLSQEELKERSEKERKERQIAQDKAAEALRKANEAAAIAVVKEQEAKEAAQVAKRKQFELAAAEQAREQAREWEEKQEKLRVRSAPAPIPKPKPKVANFFQALAPKPSPKVPEKKSAGVQLEINLPTVFKAPEPVKKVAPGPTFNFFGSPKAEAKVTPKPARQVSAPAPKALPKSTPKDTGLSFFGSLAPKASPKAAPTPAPAPLTKIAPKPVAKITPKPVPQSVTKSAPTPLFSFFGSPASSPAPKVVSAPVPKPGSTKKSTPVPPKAAPVAPKTKTEAAPQPFSFFGSPKPVPAAPKVVPPPAPAPQPFSFFGSAKPAPAPKVAPPPAPAPKPAFSFFGSSPSPPASPSTKKAPAVVTKKSTPARRSGTIALTKADPKKAAGNSFFGGGGAKTDSIPVLSKFKQNKDGSLTGIVSNTTGFRTGTKITTSPVRMGAKAGQVVTTASGSKYRLE